MNLQTLSLAVLVFATLFGTGNASASCSNATVLGVYGSLGAGFEGGAPSADVIQYTADGAGHLTGTGTNSTNGVIGTGTFTGTYSVRRIVLEA